MGVILVDYILHVVHTAAANFDFVFGEIVKYYSWYLSLIAPKTRRLPVLIVCMKKFLDVDWLRAVQFERNTLPKKR